MWRKNYFVIKQLEKSWLFGNQWPNYHGPQWIETQIQMPLCYTLSLAYFTALHFCMLLDHFPSPSFQWCCEDTFINKSFPRTKDASYSVLVPCPAQ